MQILLFTGTIDWFPFPFISIISISAPRLRNITKELTEPPFIEEPSQMIQRTKKSRNSRRYNVF